LFLDELAELPIATQAKLLRVLQDGVIEPIGATRSHKVNVRVIAATNKNIADAMRSGTFREDLYYRLNVGEIYLPALRERPSDIPKIALQVLNNVNKTLRKPKRLSQPALARLQAQSWPGNVRDLQNAIERSALMSREEVIDADDLLITDHRFVRDPLAALPEPREGFSIDAFLSSARKQLVLKALEAAKGNKSEAARMLGITPQAVHKYLSQRAADSDRP
jgi:transcriptional regulator with PAS, ATPase and Fis domain